jgi:hypothetical protein
MEIQGFTGQLAAIYSVFAVTNKENLATFSLYFQMALKYNILARDPYKCLRYFYRLL